MRKNTLNPGMFFPIALAALLVLSGSAKADDENLPGFLNNPNQSSPETHKQKGDTCGLAGDEPCGPEEKKGKASRMTDEEGKSPSRKAEHTPVSGKTACLHFWYGPGCPHCGRVEKFLHNLKAKKYPSLEIRAHNAKKEMDLYKGLLSQYEVPEPKCGRVPAVFIADHYCVGETECYEGLESWIDDCIPGGCKCVAPGKKCTLKVCLLGIASLAAVDAVNVCALAVLLILITAVLARFPENRKRMLHIAFAFMGGIFTAYFVVGLLIILGFKSMSGIGSLSTSWIYKCVGIVAILLGLFNLKDFVWYGGGGFKLEVPERWRPKMKKIIQSTMSPAGSYVVGLIVSIFLLPCALGPYFVASGLLSGLSISYAIPWLVLYNIVFILPMLIITLVVYGGFAAIKNIEEWRLKNTRKLHLVAGIILCAVGAAIAGGFI